GAPVNGVAASSPPCVAVSERSVPAMVIRKYGAPGYPPAPATGAIAHFCWACSIAGASRTCGFAGQFAATCAGSCSAIAAPICGSGGGPLGGGPPGGPPRRGRKPPTGDPCTASSSTVPV